MFPVFNLHFCIYFRNYIKIHVKRLPFSNCYYEKLTRKHVVFNLTNIMGNKSIPKLCKLNPVSFFNQLPFLSPVYYAVLDQSSTFYDLQSVRFWGEMKHSTHHAHRNMHALVKEKTVQCLAWWCSYGKQYLQTYHNIIHNLQLSNTIRQVNM